MLSTLHTNTAVGAITRFLDMGVPDFRPDRVPITLPGENGRYRMDSPWGALEFGAAWLGNPHALLIRESLEDADIPAIGACLGRHAAFPEGVNAGFAAASTVPSESKVSASPDQSLMTPPAFSTTGTSAM